MNSAKWIIFKKTKNKKKQNKQTIIHFISLL